MSSQDNVLDKKVSLKDEIVRLRGLEKLELEHEVLEQYQEHLSRSSKDFLSSGEAVDFYHQLIPFLVRELEKKKIAVDNMRTKKSDTSAIFGKVKGGPLRTVPQDIKDWLKKFEDMGHKGQEFDKLKKQLFQRDASGRLVKTAAELYTLIAAFSMEALDQSKSHLDRMDMEKKKSKLSKITSLGLDDGPLKEIPSDIQDKLKRIESADIDLAKLSEFKKRLARRKPTGELFMSHKEMYLKLFDFYEQEFKRSKAKWLRDKKLEATIDSAKSFQEKTSGPPAENKALKVFPSDIMEKVKKLEESKTVEQDRVDKLKVELLRRNSNGNLVNSYSDMCKKLADFYELVFQERSKDLEMMEQFKENNKLQSEEAFSSDSSSEGSSEEVEKMRGELARRESLASEYFARSQRLEMDIKRLRERKEKSLEEIKNKSNEKLINRLLLVLDDFERAMSASSGDDIEMNYNGLLQGVGLINRRLLNVLNKEGLKKIEAEGQEFDPKFHEAFEQVVSDKHPEDTVVEVLRQGYFIGDKLLRPSLVKVSKGS